MLKIPTAGFHIPQTRSDSNSAKSDTFNLSASFEGANENATLIKTDHLVKINKLTQNVDSSSELARTKEFGQDRTNHQQSQANTIADKLHKKTEVSLPTGLFLVFLLLVEFAACGDKSISEQNCDFNFI